MAKQKAANSTSLRIVKQFFPEVTKVTDADKPLHVTVTAGDNKSSQVRNHNACAMAVACKRQEKCDGVIVAVGVAYTIKGQEAVRYVLPPSVSREVVSFDRKAGFVPGEYQLSVPAKRIGARTGKESESNSGRQNSGGIKRRFRHFTEGIRTALVSKRAPKRKTSLSVSSTGTIV